MSKKFKQDFKQALYEFLRRLDMVPELELPEPDFTDKEKSIIEFIEYVGGELLDMLRDGERSIVVYGFATDAVPYSIGLGQFFNSQMPELKIAMGTLTMKGRQLYGFRKELSNGSNNIVVDDFEHEENYDLFGRKLSEISKTGKSAYVFVFPYPKVRPYTCEDIKRIRLAAESE